MTCFPAWSGAKITATSFAASQGNTFQHLSWDEFLRAIETGAGRDLSWFYGNGSSARVRPNGDLSGGKKEIRCEAPSHKHRLLPHPPSSYLSKATSRILRRQLSCAESAPS